MYRFFQIFFLFFLFFNFPAHAIPLHGVTIRVVPKYSVAHSEISPKAVEIAKKEEGFQIRWYSLAKSKLQNEAYPTYKVKVGRGILEIDTIVGKTKFFHPHLWGEGYIRLTESLPLWFSPEYLQLKGRDTLPFDLGILTASRLSLRAAPGEFFEKILNFQGLYEQYVDVGTRALKPEATGRLERELQSFLEKYFQVGVVAQTKAKVVVNREVQIMEAKIIGNDYYQFVVLDDLLNPLILSFQVFPDKAPNIFAEYFRFLRENFEYQITQVLY